MVYVLPMWGGSEHYREWTGPFGAGWKNSLPILFVLFDSIWLPPPWPLKIDWLEDEFFLLGWPIFSAVLVIFLGVFCKNLRPCPVDITKKSTKNMETIPWSNGFESVWLSPTSAPPTGHVRRSSKPWRSWTMTNTATMCAPCAVPTRFFVEGCLSEMISKQTCLLGAFFCSMWWPNYSHHVIFWKRGRWFRMVPYLFFIFVFVLKFIPESPWNTEIFNDNITFCDGLRKFDQVAKTIDFGGRDPNFPFSPTGADRTTTGTVWVTVLSRNCCWRRANWKGDSARSQKKCSRLLH